MTAPLPFLTVVLITQNRAAHLAGDLTSVHAACGDLSTDLQLIVIDNGSQDDSVAVLKALTAGGAADLQVLALGRSVDLDTAAWTGLDRMIGDAAIVADLNSDDLTALPDLIRAAATDTDLVFAHAGRRPGHGLRTRLDRGFYRLYRWSAGVDLSEAPRYRLLSRRVISHLHQHPNPIAAYRHLSSSAGFIRAHLQVAPSGTAATERPLREDLARAWAMLMNSSRGPIRVVSSLSLLSAAMNLLYSLYVIGVALFQAQVQPGWVTLSLQVSGMFLLLSLTLLVLGEYVLHITRMAYQGPAFLVAQEFGSTHFSRQNRLNIASEPAPVQHAPVQHAPVKHAPVKHSA